MTKKYVGKKFKKFKKPAGEKVNPMQEFSDSVVNALTNDSTTLPWVKPWSSIDSNYRNAFSGHKYRGLHNMFSCMHDISKKGYSDPRFATFAQIRKHGGKVKKGCKSTHLIFWKVLKVDDKDKVGEKKNVLLSTIHCVFNVEDIEGIEFKPIVLEVHDTKEDETIMNMLKTLNVKYKAEKCDRACYSPMSDVISVPTAEQFKSDKHWSSTILHELIHWSAKRVDHSVESYGFDIEVRAMEELVAELGAMYVSMRLGIDGWLDTNNLVYVKSWISASKSTKGNKLVYKACKLAEVRAKYILDAIGMGEVKEEVETEEVE